MIALRLNTPVNSGQAHIVAGIGLEPISLGARPIVLSHYTTRLISNYSLIVSVDTESDITVSTSIESTWHESHVVLVDVT